VTESPDVPNPATLFSLDGKVALVTGASSGLGHRFSRVLAAAGAKVALVARRVDRLTALADQLPDALVLPADLADPAAATHAVDACVAHYGQLDILVNNAGRSVTVPAFDETTEDFATTLTVNVTAAFTLAREAARTMTGPAGRGGVVINVSSILGIVGSGQIPLAGYAAAKGALVNLTRELAAQWARRGVRVNALVPGWFPSEMTGDMMTDDRSLAWLAKRTPMGRPGRPEELDGALLYLASEASSYMTGQLLVVDGGWTAI
jgi:hypothetical protein